MDKYFSVLLFIGISVHAVSGNEIERRHKYANKQQIQDVNNTTVSIVQDLLLDNSDNIYYGKNTSAQHYYSKWSPWTRCEDCWQRRTKKCVSPICRESRIYEERPCNKKRCKRKRKLKNENDFNIVQMGSNLLETRSGKPRIWSKWSKWSECSKDCRTHRFRICKKPGRCKKKRQRQKAYCYHAKTRCEQHVLHLLDAKRRIMHNNNNKYYYNQENQQKRPTVPARCGRPYRKSKMLKIIGGHESKKYKWPWHVAILNRFMEVFCSGTLIAPRWVLTAGHCVRSYLKVRLNEHDLSLIDGREVEMSVYKIFLHPRFNHQTVDNDIALLRLPKAVKLRPACLPTTEPDITDLCHIMGWGKLRSYDEYGSIKLHEARIPVVNWAACVNAYKGYLITNNMFCAGWASGAADTCAGDSGGGLMCPPRRNSNTKGFVVHGITSFGDGCGRKNKYGIYTLVYNYLGWINYIIENYS